jgi:hypothetical protein
MMNSLYFQHTNQSKSGAKRPAGKGNTVIIDHSAYNNMVTNKNSTDGFVDISFMDLETVEGNILGCNYSTTYYLDISHNCLKDAQFLKRFTKLTCLNANYNEFTSLASFPAFRALDTLSLISNNIADLNDIIINVTMKFPNLAHLSLIHNPCCPYLKPEFSEAAMDRYRLKLTSRIPRLITIDGSPITDQERAEAVEFGTRVRGRLTFAHNAIEDPAEKDQANRTVSFAGFNKKQNVK